MHSAHDHTPTPSTLNHQLKQCVLCCFLTFLQFSSSAEKNELALIAFSRKDIHRSSCYCVKYRKNTSFRVLRDVKNGANGMRYIQYIMESIKNRKSVILRKIVVSNAFDDNYFFLSIFQYNKRIFMCFYHQHFFKKKEKYFFVHSK